MNLLYIAALLPLISLVLLLAAQRREPAPLPAPMQLRARRFTHWLGSLPIYRDSGNAWRAATRRSRRLAHLSRTLQRAGINNPRDQFAVYVSMFIGANLMGTLASVVARAGGHTAWGGTYIGIATTIGFTIAAIIAVRAYADRRQRLIEEEAPTVVQITRMLWRAGLSLPRTFSVLCNELRQLAPETTRELSSALRRIETGDNQEEVLADIAQLTKSDGFREYLVITRQVSQSGGGVDQALSDLYQLLQNRRRTELQEKVSKLSAKMSVVMMSMLFPALLIVLGGPGFIAIGSALSHLGR